jgi:hypothetical protein
VAVLVGALALLARSAWKGALLPGGQNAPAEEAREADLEQKSQETLLRIKRKHRVARELWAGRLTLLEAAALFRALDHGPPALNWVHFRKSWPGSSDDERHCHIVIDWVFYNARHEMCPCQAEALRQGLDAQLREHLRRGPVRLRQLSELPPWIDD